MKNIFIKKINLSNFQKHKNLVLEFDQNVNIIFGVSGVGKSVVRRAIEWCLFNKNIDGIRKQGTKQTSVSILLSNGYEVERIRSSSINRYILKREDKELVFDACGKTIPEEIKTAINIFPIILDKNEVYLNSSVQISLPFLFDISPTERGKLFDRLTGNDVLSDTMVSFNKDIFNFSKDLKKEEENNLLLSKQIKEKEIQKEQIETIYRKGKNLIDSIYIIWEKYSKLLEIKDLITKNEEELTKVDNDLNSIKIPEIQQLQELIEKYSKLEIVRNALILNDKELEGVESSLKDLNAIPLKFVEEIGEKINRYEALYEANEKRVKIEGQLTDIINQEKDIIASLEILEKEKNMYQVCEKCNGQGYICNE